MISKRKFIENRKLDKHISCKTDPQIGNYNHELMFKDVLIHVTESLKGVGDFKPAAAFKNINGKIINILDKKKTWLHLN